MKISGVFFAIVILAFLLPFVVVKCGDTKLMTINGVKLVTGGTLEKETDAMVKKLSGGLGGMLSTDNMDMSELKDNPMKPSIFAILAILMAVVGLITAFVLPADKKIIPALAGLLGLVFLVVIMVGAKSEFPKNMGGGEMAQIADMIKVTMGLGFWLALIGFLVAAVTAFLSREKSYAAMPAYQAPAYPPNPMPVEPQSMFEDEVPTEYQEAPEVPDAELEEDSPEEEPKQD